MNIFVLDLDINSCAKCYSNKHVIKQLLEATQLLNNAYTKHNPKATPIYKPTHISHPCSLWCSKTASNFHWLSSLGLALCSEYTYRYGKVHKCQNIIEFFDKGNFLLPKGDLTPFVQCMPEIYKSNNVVESYREYYRKEKRHIATWSKRSIPNWWNI